MNEKKKEKGISIFFFFLQVSIELIEDKVSNEISKKRAPARF